MLGSTIYGRKDLSCRKGKIFGKNGSRLWLRMWQGLLNNVWKGEVLDAGEDFLIVGLDLKSGKNLSYTFQFYQILAKATLKLISNTF